ncbi:MAG TPA: MerR family transcriptional regulator [Thermomicrobiales bacterium]|nr:MerR family transcriptional regulator [Thermomicrobiales bacterium]
MYRVGMMSDVSAQQAAKRTGLSVHTLRYYERAGLIPRVSRAANSHRRYSELDLEWIAFVAHMREAGMAIADIRRYTELVLQGETTVSRRLELLEAHRTRLADQIAQLGACLAILDGKIAGYRAHHDGCVPNGAADADRKPFP